MAVANKVTIGIGLGALSGVLLVIGPLASNYGDAIYRISGAISWVAILALPLTAQLIYRRPVRTVSYGDALLVAVISLVTASLIGGAGLFAVFSFDHSFPDAFRAYTLASAARHPALREDPKLMRDIANALSSPTALATMGSVGTLLMGFIVALVTSFFVRKRA